MNDDFSPDVDYAKKTLERTTKLSDPIPFRLATLSAVYATDLQTQVSSSFLESSERWRAKQRLVSELQHLVKKDECMTDAKKKALNRIINGFHTKPVLGNLQQQQKDQVSNRAKGMLASSMTKFRDGDHMWKGDQMKSIVKRLHTAEHTKRMETESR